MRFSTLFISAALAASARACDKCPHEGTFTNATLGLLYPPNPNRCDVNITESDIAISIPSKFYDPPDESPCGGPANVTNVVTGVTILATVVGECDDCLSNNLLITAAGLAALASDGDADHAPGTVTWTFD